MGKILILDEHSSVQKLTSAELGNEGHLVVPIAKPCLIRVLTHQVQKNLRKVLYGLGSMGCKLLFPSLYEHHPR